MVIVFCLKNTPASSQFEFVWFLASVDNFCIAFLIGGREGTSVFHFNLWQRGIKHLFFCNLWYQNRFDIISFLGLDQNLVTWIQLQASYGQTYTSFYYCFKTTDTEFILNAKIFILFSVRPLLMSFLYLDWILSSTVSFLSLFQGTNHIWQKNLRSVVGLPLGSREYWFDR